MRPRCTPRNSEGDRLVRRKCSASGSVRFSKAARSIGVSSPACIPMASWLRGRRAKTCRARKTESDRAMTAATMITGIICELFSPYRRPNSHLQHLAVAVTGLRELVFMSQRVIQPYQDGAMVHAHLQVVRGTGRSD